MNPTEEWRRRAAEGTLSKDELRQAIIALRESRLSAAPPEKKVSVRKKKTGEEKTAEDGRKQIDLVDFLKREHS